MANSAEIVNEMGTKQVRPSGSKSKYEKNKLSNPENQGCPLKNLIQKIELKGGKPSMNRLSSEIAGLSASDRASAVKGLQSTRGNRYVQRVVAQAKLAISQPGDQYEQEADRVAEQVTGMSESHNLQRKCPLRNKDYALNTKGISGQAPSPIAGTNVPLLVNGVLGSPGQPLDTVTRTFMESRFGHDFSRVKIHVDAQAAKSARAVNALAFTVGPEIVFDVGQYAPEAKEGRRLLAHELTHVVQQTGMTQAGGQSYQPDAQGMPSAYEAREGPNPSPNISSTSELVQRREVCDEEGNCQSVQDDADSETPQQSTVSDPGESILALGSMGEEAPPDTLRSPQGEPLGPQRVPNPVRVVEPGAQPETPPGDLSPGEPQWDPNGPDTLRSPQGEPLGPQRTPNPVRVVKPGAPPGELPPGGVGILGGIGLGAALVGLSAFAATMLWSNKTAPAWMDEINPITRKPYSSQEEYDKVHGK